MPAQTITEAAAYRCGGCDTWKSEDAFYPSNPHYCKDCNRRSGAVARDLEQETRAILATVPWRSDRILAERRSLRDTAAEGMSDQGWWLERHEQLLDAQLADQIRRLNLSVRDYLILSDPRIEYPWPLLGRAP